MSGSASKGILRNDQIPASTSSSVPVNTRKRFCAHQSIQREITLHSSRGVHAELFAGHDLPVLPRKNRDLPRSPAVQLSYALIEAISFFSERNLRPHGGHTHRRHGGHGKGDRNLRTGDWPAACVGKVYPERVGAFPGKIGIGCEFRLCPWSVHRSCCACAWRRGNKCTECRLELAFRVDQEVGGRDDLFAYLHSFQDDEVVSRARAELHSAWFDVAVAAGDENNLPRSRLQNASGWNDQLLSHSDFQCNVDEHPWSQFQTGI